MTIEAPVVTEQLLERLRQYIAADVDWLSEELDVSTEQCR
jgi:hypothetical protein